MYGHFGDGCVHVRIDFPLRDRPAVLRSFTQDAARLAASYGGSASGEHGDGRARGELLPAMYSAEAIGLFGAVKRLFDPANLLNPGVIVDPAPLDADLRVPVAPPLRRGLGFAYPQRRGRLHRRRAPLRGRRQVPRGHHRVRRRDVPVVPGHPGREGLHPGPRPGAAGAGERVAGVVGWQSPEVAEALDLCLSCKGCSSDCPAGVDMATYKAEALYQRYRGRLRPASHYSLGWLPRWAALTARARGAVAGQRVAARAAGGRRGQAARRHRRSGATARVRAAELPPLVRRARGGRQPAGRRRQPALPATSGASAARRAARPCCCGWTRSPTRSRRRSAEAAVTVLEAAGYEVRITAAQRLLRPHLDLDRPAGRRAAAAAAHAARARPGARRGHPGRRPRAVLHGGAARRRGRTAAGRPARRARSAPR